jgi:hypothetical protein
MTNTYDYSEFLATVDHLSAPARRTFDYLAAHCEIEESASQFFLNFSVDELFTGLGLTEQCLIKDVDYGHTKVISSQKARRRALSQALEQLALELAQPTCDNFFITFSIYTWLEFSEVELDVAVSTAFYYYQNELFLNTFANALHERLA